MERAGDRETGGIKADNERGLPCVRRGLFQLAC